MLIKELMKLDRKKLNQYKALQKEIPKLKSDIEKLEHRLSQIPIVAGKVTKSSDDFPYVEEHVTVEMEEPRAATEIKKQIRLKEQRLNQAEIDKTAIETFINGIEDSKDRQVFELYFLDDKSQGQVADILGYERSNISKIINRYC